MCISRTILLPCDGNNWKDIKHILTRITEEKLCLSESLRLLDVVRNLFYGSTDQNELTGNILPVHNAYVGLGNFVYLCMHQKERKHFESHVFPFIINCIVISEQFAFEYRSLQSLQNQSNNCSFRSLNYFQNIVRYCLMTSRLPSLQVRSFAFCL